MNRRWARDLVAVCSTLWMFESGALALPDATPAPSVAEPWKRPMPVAVEPKLVEPAAAEPRPVEHKPLEAKPPEVPSVSSKTPVATGHAVPRFVKLLPERYNKDEIIVAVDQELKLAIVVEHPDGIPVALEALGLPPGASFDPELHSISWRPTDAERGTYQVRLRATVGGAEASRSLILEVRGNQPPSISTVWLDAVVGERGQWSVGATDPEGGPVVVTVSGLPRGATADADGNIAFQPEPDQVGEHAFEVSVSDGKRTAARTAHIRVSAPPEPTTELDEWTSYWLPGVGYSVYTPRAAAVGDVFHGLALEIVIAAWIHRNDNHGPSHGRVYINAELLDSDVKARPLLFTYAAGLSLSFERNPTRSWLVPYYGLDLGGMVHQELGGLFQTTPHLGVHLFSNPNVFVGARAGYRLVPSRIDSLAGFHASLTADVTIW